jgi:hypothetical protein
MSATTATSDVSGACLVGRVAALATTNATALKTGAGNVYAFFLCGSTAVGSTVYFKFYDKASAPVVGTDTPLFTVPVISTTTLAGWVDIEVDPGITFKNGIAFAITGGVADSDATAVALNSLHGAIFYK